MILSTPLGLGSIAAGETAWALLRGGFYAVVFVGVMAAMGLVTVAWALLLIPAALLVGAAFAGLGMLGMTYMRNWTDFDLSSSPAATVPLLGDLRPARRLPDGGPLAGRGDAALPGCRPDARPLTRHGPGPGSLLDVAYLVAIAAVCITLASRRMGRSLVS